MSDQIYLSIVQGIGGNLTDDLILRLNKSIKNTTQLADRYLPHVCEIVIVEWNLPPMVATVLPFVNWPKTLTKIRLIHVPRELHVQQPNPHGFKYFEWYPKNIGIRRAHGDFVLSTNPDDLFSEELFDWFGQTKLAKGYFYRVNRHDTREGKVFRVLHATGPHSPDATASDIRFQVAVRAAPWSADMLHYSAAGDFTLMARDDWYMIHGNPEREYNDSVDGQTLFLAYQKGLRQIVLPFPVYHPDHDRTLNHSTTAGRSHGGTWDDRKPFTKMNEDNWGFAGIDFPETEI